MGSFHRMQFATRSLPARAAAWFALITLLVLSTSPQVMAADLTVNDVHLVRFDLHNEAGLRSPEKALLTLHRSGKAVFWQQANKNKRVLHLDTERFNALVRQIIEHDLFLIADATAINTAVEETIRKTGQLAAFADGGVTRIELHGAKSSKILELENLALKAKTFTNIPELQRLDVTQRRLQDLLGQLRQQEK